MPFLADQPPEHLEAFPAPVNPCESVAVIRRQRLFELTRVTVLGILIRLVVIAAEFVGVALSGSSVLLVDAVASLFDVVSSLVLLGAIRFAARPPDDDHPFGHGRVEPLAGFQLSILLCGTGLWMAWQNLLLLSRAGENHAALPGWVWVIPAGATLLLGTVTWLIRRAGMRMRSTALIAEAAHFQIDTATSFVAAGMLLVAACVPGSAATLDHVGGGLLALVMVGLGALAARENVNQLLDRIPREEDFERVKSSALAVEGVIDVEKVRIQHAGPDAHVDIDIEVAPEISVAQSHGIAQHVRARIQSDWPFVREVVVHVEPFYAGDH